MSVALLIVAGAIAALIVALALAIGIGRLLEHVSESYPPLADELLRSSVDVLARDDWGFRWHD